MKRCCKLLSSWILVMTTTQGFAFVVNNNADSGAGSLRQAILDANASGGGTITFSGVSGTITLMSALPPLTSGINIAGPGAAQLTVSGSGVAVLTNATANHAVLSGLTLQSGGTAYGNAIANLGTLVVSNCVVSHGRAVFSGTPGIYNSGNLSATNCIFADNQGVDGGAILNEGVMQLTLCTVTNNVADMGGGILNLGTLSLDYCTVARNRFETSGYTGGIYNAGGTLILRNCFVTDNLSLAGGGIWNSAQLAITNCTISSNRAEYTDANEEGGGLFNSGSAILQNSTVSGNRVAGGKGGGIRNSGTLLLLNSTVVSNTAFTSDPLPADTGGISNAGTLQSKNSIVAGNLLSTDPGPSVAAQDIAGNLDSLGHNLIQSSSGWTNVGAGAGDRVGIDPKLGPLQDNGGPTWTHALLQNSPAIDAGDATGAPTEDQRGVHRPQGFGVDIGAYEFQFAVPVLARIAVQDRTNVWLQAVGLPGRRYTLQLPGGLGGSSNIATMTAGPDGVMQHIDYGYAKYPRRFYRLQGTTP